MAAVLVVEDDKDLREIMAMLLESLGFQVCAACNGVAALRCIACSRPDVVVADWAMPEMDGVTLGRTIRGWPPGQRIPVLLMSAGYTERQAPADAYDAFMEKPPRIQDLVAKVTELAEVGVR